MGVFSSAGSAGRISSWNTTIGPPAVSVMANLSNSVLCSAGVKGRSSTERANIISVKFREASARLVE